MKNLSQRERGLWPTAYRSPLYPVLLTGCVALGEHCRLAIAMLHLAMGAATAGFVWWLGRWWGLGRVGAFFAAMLVACDPILLRQSTLVMTETPATFLVVAGLVLLTRLDRNPTAVRAFMAGIILALAALCRPSLLLWTVPVAASVAWNSRRPTTGGGRSSHFRVFAAFACGVLLALCPWAVRNQLEFGRPIVTTTHGGYTLLLANNPEFYQWLRTAPWGDVWRADRFNAAWEKHKPSDELQADRLAYRKAWQTIRSRPETFFYASLVRVGRFWSPLPHRISPDETARGRWARYAVGVWYIAEYLLVAVGIGWGWRKAAGGRRPRAGDAHHTSRITHHSSSNPQSPISNPFSAFRLPASALFLLAVLTAVHAIYWTDMRMRAPLVPVLALFAAAAIHKTWNESR